MHPKAIKHRRHYYHTYESEITQQLLVLSQINLFQIRDHLTKLVRL